MVSGYLTSMCLPRVDGLSTDSPSFVVSQSMPRKAMGGADTVVLSNLVNHVA